MSVRLNHSQITDELRKLGYEVFIADFSMGKGTHGFQLEKGENGKENYEWHEYDFIREKGNNAKLDVSGVDNENVKNLLKEYYSNLGVEIMN
jgi:hypothetical protein